MDWSFVCTFTIVGHIQIRRILYARLVMITVCAGFFFVCLFLRSLSIGVAFNCIFFVFINIHRFILASICLHLACSMLYHYRHTKLRPIDFWRINFFLGLQKNAYLLSALFPAFSSWQGISLLAVNFRRQCDVFHKRFLSKLTLVS